MFIKARVILILILIHLTIVSSILMKGAPLSLYKGERMTLWGLALVFRAIFFNRKTMSKCLFDLNPAVASCDT